MYKPTLLKIFSVSLVWYNKCIGSFCWWERRIRETIITHGCCFFSFLFFFLCGGMASLIKVRTLDHREFDYDRTFVTSTINSRKWSAAWRDENEVIAFSCALTRKRFRFWHGVCRGNFGWNRHRALQMSRKSIRRKVKEVISICRKRTPWPWRNNHIGNKTVLYQPPRHQ